MKRHKLTKQTADNSKSSHVAVNADIINEFFDNLTTTLKNIPKESIFNYDDRNIIEDPGSKTVTVQKGHGHKSRQKG